MPASHIPKPSPKTTKHIFKHAPGQTAQPPATLSPQSAKPKVPKFLKICFIFFAVLFLIITPPAAYVTWYFTSFAQAAGLTTSQIITTIKSGLNTSVKSDQGRTNILILGIDAIAGQKESSLLTDTNLIASYNHSTHALTLLSLPRDLWVNAFKTKINAIYYYGEISPDTTGIEFATTVFGQITGQPLHYYAIVDLTILQQVIDSIGGIQIDVPASFTDEKFPRSDVDVTAVTDPRLLYETVSFQQGLQHFDGATALKYIRSRQSDNQIEGTDLARSRRQQQLISAIIDRISNSDTFQNPHLMGNLYQVIRRNLNTNLSDQDIIALAKINGRTPPVINGLALPIQDQDQVGLIFHPPLTKYDQWVYEPIDPTWQDLNDFVNTNL